MKKEYLSEAFRQLELLNEEDFNLSTTADNSDLKDFLDNDDMSVMSLDVIDPEAETEEDLEDSYTGKVILDCCVCHSKLYKDKEEVQIDEEQDLANVGEECPFCYSNDGFKIIGEVAPYGETEEETEEDKPLELDFEKETEIDESIRKGLELKEGFMGQTLDDFLGDWNNAENISIWCYDENEDGPVFEGDVSDIPDKYLNAQFDDFDTEGKIYVNISDVDEDFDESLKTRKNRKLKESLKGAHAKLIADEDEIRDYLSDDYPRDLRTALKHLGDTGRVVDDSIHVTVRFSGGDRVTLPEMFFEFDMDESLKTRKNRKLKEASISKSTTASNWLNNFYKERNQKVADMDDERWVLAKINQSTESYGEYSHKVFDDGVPVLKYWYRGETRGLDITLDSGEIVVIRELDEGENDWVADEIWAVVGKGWALIDEDVEDVNYTVISNESLTTRRNKSVSESVNESIQEIEIETDTDKIKIESEPKEESGETEDILAPVSPETEQQIENNSSDEIDVPIDEFDEETFDELGESFLKNTYENVKGYKTESIKEQDGNKLVIEGLITFNSGKVKKTSFIFEAKDITKSGKVRFIGENCQLSRGKKSFTIAGKVQEGKFISESLNYNYRAKDAKSGKSTRMYGTVRTNK